MNIGGSVDFFYISIAERDVRIEISHALGGTVYIKMPKEFELIDLHNTPQLTNKDGNSIAGRYVDGRIEFGEMSASLAESGNPYRIEALVRVRRRWG